MKQWSKTLEPEIQKYVDKIMDTDFVKLLIEEKISNEEFSVFLTQDMIYLNAFKGSLLFLTERLNKAEEALFRQFIYGSTEAEVAILKQYDYNHDAKYTLPITREYIDFERKVCLQEPIYVGLAALLPCFWIFFKVMESIKQQSSKNNPFRLWIEGYSNPYFIEDIEKYRAICDKYASSEIIKRRMNRAFIEAAEYELKFWNQIK